MLCNVYKVNGVPSPESTKEEFNELVRACLPASDIWRVEHVRLMVDYYVVKYHLVTQNPFSLYWRFKQVFGASEVFTSLVK